MTIPDADTYFEIKESIRLENENIIIVKTFLFKKERYYFNYKDFEISKESFLCVTSK